MMKPLTYALAALLTFAFAAPASAAEDEKLYDVTKNPGCGVKLTKKEDKIARAKRYAEYYFAGWRSPMMYKHGHQYRFEDHNCFLPTTTYRMGYGLKPEPPELLSKPYVSSK